MLKTDIHTNGIFNVGLFFGINKVQAEPAKMV